MTLRLAAEYGPWGLTLVCILAAAALVIGWRNRTFWWRLVAVVFLLLLVLRPELAWSSVESRARKVVLLLDTSGSMGVKEGGASRLGRAAQIAVKIRQQVKGLTVVPFNEEAGEPLKDDAAILAQAATDRGTNFAAAFEAVAASGLDPAQVILVSDGNDTTDNDAVAAARKLGAPVNIVMVGREVAGAGGVDVRVAHVHCRSQVDVGSLEPVEIDVEADRAAGQTATVRLLDAAGAVLQTAELVLDGLPGPQTVTMNFKPEKLGLNDLTVQVAPLAGETLLENNRADFSVDARPRRPKLLYLESEMRPDYRFLRRALATDPRLEFMSLVQARPGVFLKQGEIAGLALSGFPRTAADFASLDALVLGNFAPAELAPVAAALEEAVKGGMGMLVLPGAYATGAESAGGLSFLPGRPAGQSVMRPLTTVAGEKGFFPGGKDLGVGLPLAGVDKMLPAEHARAVLKVELPEGDLPVLLAANHGAGRVAVFAGHDAWRWPPAAYAEFWGALARWLLKQDSDAPADSLVVTATPTMANIGEKVLIAATNPRDVALRWAVRPAGAAPGAAPVAQGEFSRNEKEKRWTAEVALQQAGGYVVTVVGEEKGLPPMTRELALRVRPARSEFASLAPDRDFLQRLADATGGIFYRNAAPLTDLKLRKEERLPLWNRKLLFVLIGLTLVGEWLWRKHLGLP